MSNVAEEAAVCAACGREVAPLLAAQARVSDLEARIREAGIEVESVAPVAVAPESIRTPIWVFIIVSIVAEAWLLEFRNGGYADSVGVLIAPVLAFSVGGWLGFSRRASSLLDPSLFAAAQPAMLHVYLILASYYSPAAVWAGTGHLVRDAIVLPILIFGGGVVGALIKTRPVPEGRFRLQVFGVETGAMQQSARLLEKIVIPLLAAMGGLVSLAKVFWGG